MHVHHPGSIKVKKWCNYFKSTELFEFGKWINPELEILLHLCEKNVIPAGSNQAEIWYKAEAPVVRKVDNAIHGINLYPVDIAIGFPNIYPLYRNLSGQITLSNVWTTGAVTLPSVLSNKEFTYAFESIYLFEVVFLTFHKNHSGLKYVWRFLADVYQWLRLYI